jgi:hypothetical protein
MSQGQRLFGKMPRAFFERSPSSRGNLQKHIGPRRWLRRSFTSCLMRQLMVSGDWWFLKQSGGSNSWSFPYCGLGVPSCVSPLLAHQGEESPVCEDAG